MNESSWYFWDFKKFNGTGIILTNNETKDLKVIKPLENRGVLLKNYYKNY